MCCRTSPAIPQAVAGLARAYLQGGDVERAKATLEMVRPDGAQDEAIRAVASRTEAARKRPRRKRPRRRRCDARLAAEPADHQARWDLALALDAAGDREAAVDELLELVRRDRKWNEEAARKQLVVFFEAMGFTDPRTIEARRKLSGISFPDAGFQMPRHYHSFTDLPKSLPLFPLTGAVLLPRGALPLNIFEPRYLEMVEYALQGDRLIGMIQPTEHEDTTLKPKLSQVGCAGKSSPSAKPTTIAI